MSGKCKFLQCVTSFFFRQKQGQQALGARIYIQFQINYVTLYKLLFILSE